MISFALLRVLRGSVLALATIPFALASAQSAYVVGPNVQVTHADSGRAVQETYICADPRDARHLVAAAIIERGDTTANAFFVSFDRGVSWRQTLLLNQGVDPSCAISAEGVALAAGVRDSLPSGTSYLNVLRSRDGGRTWTESVVHRSIPSLDRPYVTSGLNGHFWIHGYVQAPRAADGTRTPAVAVLYASSDFGRAFDRVTVLPGTAFPTPWFFPANGIATADGTFIGLVVELDNTQRNMFRGRSDSASAPHSANGELRVIRSRNRGLVETSRISSAYYDWRVPQLSMSALAVDRSTGPFRGRLYAAWPDARYGGRTQILLSHSDDTGHTWSAARVVSDGPDTLGFGPNNFMPMVAVSRTGAVGLSWYDRRDSSDSLSYVARFRASRDGGDSWLPSVQVSREPNRLKPTDRHLNGGDTSGLAVDADGRFHLVWIDNRTGVAQAWTASVEVAGAGQVRTRRPLGSVPRPATER